MGYGRARRRISAIALVTAVVASLVAIEPPATAAGFTPETLSVPVASISGVETEQILQRGKVYRAVAEGTFDYGVQTNKQIGDAECTMDRSGFNPISGVEPFPIWTRYRFAFYGSPLVVDPNTGNPNPYTLPNTDYRDPDPTDDAPDLYIDNRNVEWWPVPDVSAEAHPHFPPLDRSPADVSVEHPPSPLGCHNGDPASDPHRYEVFFTPTDTRRVNFRIFDVFYDDNGPESLSVTVEEVGGAGAPVGPHVETVLVSPQNAGSGSTALPPRSRDYVLVVRGMWTYNTLFDLADAECTRTKDDPTYERDRFADAGGELLVNGLDLDWTPAVPAQVGVRTFPRHTPATAATEGCDGLGHVYWTVVSANGGQLDFSLVDPVTSGPNTGHLSVDIFELA